MFFSSEHLSDMEKIDSIYRMLKSQQRSRRIGLCIKLVLIASIWYGYYYLSLPEHADIRKQITDTAQARMTEFIVPMVNDMVQNMAGGALAPQTSTGVRKRNTSGQTTTTPTITPEMIKAVQDAMKK